MSSPHQLQQAGGLFQTGPGSSFLIQDGHFTQHNQAPTLHYCYDSDGTLLNNLRIVEGRHLLAYLTF